jgi:transcriptional regulator with PAS, ATPase and Fis domain
MNTIASLKTLLDSLEEGVLFLDAHRRVVGINAAATQLLGSNDRDVIGKLCPSLFAGTQCAHECATRGHCSLVPEAAAARKTQDITLKRGDAEVTLRMWAMLLPLNDAGVHCSIVLRDRSREVALEAEVRQRWRLGGLVGRTPAMQALYAQILRAAASDANVLIGGESGVGKELVARALHDNSPRAQGPFVPLDCGALPENLLESELFGHAKGAFSGAAAVRVGRFEAASGGTLMLDEIGEISPAMQTKLLRVLQEREVVRLGENLPRKVDVRVVAATHRDLAAMVQHGQFREDLYYRLRVLPLQIAPLRDRTSDITLLAARMLGQLAERYRRAPLRVSPEALTALEAYRWPGNVRQLFNALEFAMVQADGPVILPHHLPPEILAPQAADRVMPHAPAAAAGLHHASMPAPAMASRYYRPAVPRDAEPAMIRRVLEEAGGNRAEAARRLGMSRTTLWKRLKQAKPD